MADSILLTHGAGSNREAALLVAVDGALSAAGWSVRRMDLPFRQARPTGPPRAGDPERDREGLLRAVADVRDRCSGRVFLGGHSYGGRQATLLAAEDAAIVDGLLLLSYPLHPPRRPSDLRVAHLPNLRAPAMFVHGSRDPFGSIAELRSAIELIPARTRLVEIEGARHDLISKRGTALDVLAERITREFLDFMS